MKPILEKIIRPFDQSFQIRTFEEKYFSSPWHFHPEVEILLVINGYGTRFVGDSVKNFYPGDLCIIGTNTPHVFLCNSDFYKPESLFNSRAICIQFDQGFWGRSFLELAELQTIKGLLVTASRGIQFVEETAKILGNKILKFPEIQGVKRITHLLEILEIMATGKDQIVLSSPNYLNIKVNHEDIGRMENLYDYVFKNFSREITIEEVASLVNLSKNSFCRYFRTRTNKVFSEFLSEVRIGNACKMLIEDKHSISQICGESGFNNISNFYRQFKQSKMMTPSEFQKKYMNRINIDPYS
jgi:AraC-like DNA-binding protein